MPKKPKRGSPTEKLEPRRLFRSTVLLASTAMLAAAGVFSVWTHTTALHLGYELSKADQEQRALHREYLELRSRVAALKSPARLERVAREELGLGPADPTQTVRVRARLAELEADASR